MSLGTDKEDVVEEDMTWKTVGVTEQDASNMVRLRKIIHCGNA